MDLLFQFLKFSKIWLLGFCEDGRAFGACGKSEGENLCHVASSSNVLYDVLVQWHSASKIILLKESEFQKSKFKWKKAL